MATQTDYVGQVQGRMESLADGFMARAISLAQADMAVLDEQLEHARKKLRGEKGALVTASSAMAPPTRAPLATITEASNSPRIEAAAAKPAPRAPSAAAAARPSPATNGNDSVAKARALVESYTFKELQRELKSRELRAAGKKQELKARLETALVAELDASKKSAPMEEEEVVEAPPAPAPAPKASPRAAPAPKAASPPPAPKALSPPPAPKAAPVPKPASPRVASPKPAPQKAAAAPRAPPPLPPRPASPAPPRPKSPRPAHEACAEPAPESPKPGLGFVASMQSLFGGKKDGVQEPPKSAKPAAQPTPQPDRLAEVRARQLQQQKAREHAAAARERETQQRLAAEKKRRDLEEAARRVAALKRQEEVAKRRQEQREADLKRKAGMDAPPPPPPTSNYSPAPAGTAGPPPPPAAAALSPHRPPALASKPARLTPGPDAAAKKAAAPAKAAPQPRSPLDTYEISDREDSTDDEDENEERQRKKHMPDWARGSALREALKGQRDADPGQVFIIGGATCELAAIFKTDRSFKKRTSSQNWGADLASRGEQQRYKQDMGFESPARGPL